MKSVVLGEALVFLLVLIEDGLEIFIKGRVVDVEGLKEFDEFVLLFLLLFFLFFVPGNEIKVTWTWLWRDSRRKC